MHRDIRTRSMPPDSSARAASRLCTRARFAAPSPRRRSSPTLRGYLTFGILHGLINLNYGSWEGMTAEESQMYDPVAFNLYRTEPLKCVCPNGERLDQAQERMLAALRLIGGRHTGESIVAITHAVMIRLVIATILDLSGEDWRVPLGRGSITEVVVDGGRISIGEGPGFAGSSDVPGVPPAMRSASSS